MPPADWATTLAALSGIGVAAALGVGALAWRAATKQLRAARRLRLLCERARGVVAPAGATAAALSLARQTKKSRIDRVAHRWLPRKDLLAARLARTGRQISIGQYVIACAVLSILAATILTCLIPIGSNR